MNKHLRELLKNTTLNVTYLMVQLIHFHTVNRRYTKGVPFSRKMVYKSVKG